MCVATGIVTSWKEMTIARVVTVAHVGNWIAIATETSIRPSTWGFALACMRERRSPKRARPTAAARDRTAPRKMSTAEMMSRTTAVLLSVAIRSVATRHVLGVLGARVRPGALALSVAVGVSVVGGVRDLGDLDVSRFRALLLRIMGHMPVGGAELGQGPRLGAERHRIGLRHVPRHTDRTDETEHREHDEHGQQIRAVGQGHIPAEAAHDRGE